MSSESALDKQLQFAMSHLGIIRLFVFWGILESLIFLLTKGDRLKSLTIYLAIFIVLTLIAYSSPNLIEFF
jgi:hypothetical protein